MTTTTIDERERGNPWWASFEAVFVVIAAAALLAAAVGSALPESLRAIGQPALVAAVLMAGFAWRPVPGLLAFALFILFYDTTAWYIGNPLRRVDEIAVPGLVLIALARLRPWRDFHLDPVRDGGVALAVAAGIASSVVNGVPLAVWVPALGLLWKTVAIFYVASWATIDRRALIGAMRVVFVVGAIVVSLAFIESFDPGAFQRALGLPGWVRPRGQLVSVKSIFVHPAIFASFGALIALYAYAGYVEYRRIWMLVLGTFASLNVFMAARRRAIAAAVAGLIVAFAWAWTHVRAWRPIARSWLPVAASGLVLFLIFLPGLLGLYSRTLRDYLPTDPQPTPPPNVAEPPDGVVSTRARSALYGGSVEIATDSFPLGGGLGRFGSHMSRVEYSPLYREYGLSGVRGLQPDNTLYVTDTFWPMILGESGVLGLIGYATFLAALAVGLWRSAGRQSDRLLRAFCHGTLAVLIAATIESVATPMFVSPPRAFLLFLAVGAAVAVARSQQPAQELIAT